MLRVTRTWNSVCAASFMRHGLGLASDYARKRRAFGRLLVEQPLHIDTLSGIDAESAAAFVLTFFLIELLGREETMEIDDEHAALLRFLLPIVKAATGKQASATASEAIEAFGGAGYVEDTGLPVLLRDSQVLPIWEGTTDVLCLDLLLRADIEAGLRALRNRVTAACTPAHDESLRRAGDAARAAFEHACQWRICARDSAALQAGARRFALTLARAASLALLVDLAANIADPLDRAAACATCGRFRRHAIDLIWDD
jgi:hypothetical protein